MSACIEILTLSQLKEKNNININVITQDVALEICDKEKANHESGLEMLCLWTKKLHKFYGLSNFSTGNWSKLVGLLKYVLQKMLAEAPDDKNNVAVELEGWLQECHDFLQTASKQVQLINLTILLNFMLHTLVEFSGFHEQWNKHVNLKSHVVEVLKLHDLILHLINAHTEKFDLKNEQQQSEFVKTNELLCLFGAQSKLMGVKTIVETWKCVVRLVNVSAQSPLKSVVVKRPVKFLLLEVGRNVDMIYNQEALSRPLIQIEKYLRVTNFYLGLLKRILIDYKHDQFPCIEEFFNVFTKIHNVPDFIIGTDVERVLKAYVLTELQELLKVTFQHEDLSKLLLKNASQLALGIIQDYMHVCVAEGDDNFLNERYDLWARLFERSFTDVRIFVKEDLTYSSLMEYFAVVAMTSSTFSMYIRTNIAQSHNLLILHASLEIILCVANALEPEQCGNELKFWNNCNAKYAVFSSQLNARYMQWLLSYLFTLCKKNGQVEKFTTFQKPRTAKDYRKSMLWVLQNKDQTDFNRDLLLILNNNNNNLDIYYNAVMYLRLLGSASEEVLLAVVKVLVQVLDNGQRFVVFEDAAFKLLTQHVGQIKNGLLEMLLKKLQQQLPHNMSPSVAILNFLCACAQNNFTQKLSKTVIRNIAHIKWCGVRFESSKSTNDNAHFGIGRITGLLEESNFNMKRHECPEIFGRDCVSPKQKRARFSQEDDETIPEENEDNFIEILKSMHDNSKDILKLERKLYTEEVQLVCAVVENFQSVLQKNL